MVRSVESNIYITSLQSDDQKSSTGSYELTQGPVVKTLDRYQRATDPDLGDVWRGLCAIRVGLQNRTFSCVEHRPLSANRDAYALEVSDSRGNTIRGTIFTEKTSATTPSTTAIRSVQVSCRGDRLHFNSSLTEDVQVVQEAFQQAVDVFLKQTI